MSKDAVALSLFSGIGGFEVGMARCGFSFAKTLEYDKKCCETLNRNKKLLAAKEENIVPRDITRIAPEDFYKGEVDYMVGGQAAWPVSTISEAHYLNIIAIM